MLLLLATHTLLAANRLPSRSDDHDPALLAHSATNSVEVAPTLVEEEVVLHSEQAARELDSIAMLPEVASSNEVTRLDLRKDEDSHRRLKCAQVVPQRYSIDVTT